MLFFLLFFFHLLLDLLDNASLLLISAHLLLILHLNLLVRALSRVKSQELIKIRLVTELGECLVAVMVGLVVVVQMLVHVLMLMDCFRG